MPFTISYVGGTHRTNSVVLTELDQSQTAVTFSPASPVFGQSVALTATVTGPTGSPPPTGTVQFFNGTTSLGTRVASDRNGPAMLNVTTLPVAANSITAQYSGDSNFAGSTSPAVTVTVGQVGLDHHVDPVDARRRSSGRASRSRRRFRPSRPARAPDRDGPVLQRNDLAGHGDSCQRHRQHRDEHARAGGELDHRAVFG